MSGLEGVPASDDAMSLDRRIQKELAQSSKPTRKKKAKADTEPQIVHTGQRGVVFTPAGSCPITPEGYRKENWQERQFDEELIRSWSLGVYQAGQQRGVTYSAHAIVYFAREFWEINNPSFKNVRAIILEMFQADQG